MAQADPSAAAPHLGIPAQRVREEGDRALAVVCAQTEGGAGRRGEMQQDGRVPPALEPVRSSTEPARSSISLAIEAVNPAAASGFPVAVPSCSIWV